jgi:hypothetical protein
VTSRAGQLDLACARGGQVGQSSALSRRPCGGPVPRGRLGPARSRRPRRPARPRDRCVSATSPAPRVQLVIAAPAAARGACPYLEHDWRLHDDGDTVPPRTRSGILETRTTKTIYDRYIVIDTLHLLSYRCHPEGCWHQDVQLHTKNRSRRNGQNQSHAHYGLELRDRCTVTLRSGVERTDRRARRWADEPRRQW